MLAHPVECRTGIETARKRNTDLFPNRKTSENVSHFTCQSIDQSLRFIWRDSTIILLAAICGCA